MRGLVLEFLRNRRRLLALNERRKSGRLPFGSDRLKGTNEATISWNAAAAKAATLASVVIIPNTSGALVNDEPLASTACPPTLHHCASLHDEPDAEKAASGDEPDDEVSPTIAPLSSIDFLSPGLGLSSSLTRSAEPSAPHDHEESSPTNAAATALTADLMLPDPTAPYWLEDVEAAAAAVADNAVNF